MCKERQVVIDTIVSNEQEGSDHKLAEKRHTYYK